MLNIFKQTSSFNNTADKPAIICLLKFSDTSTKEGVEYVKSKQ